MTTNDDDSAHKPEDIKQVAKNVVKKKKRRTKRKGKQGPHMLLPEDFFISDEQDTEYYKPSLRQLKGSVKRWKNPTKRKRLKKWEKEEVLLRLMEDQPLTHIGRLSHMPSLGQIYYEIHNNPDFAHQVDSARRFSAMAAYDELVQLEMDIIQGVVHPVAGNVAANILKWRAERMDNRRFGAKATITQKHEGAIEHKHGIMQGSKLEEVLTKIRHDSKKQIESSKPQLIDITPKKIKEG